MKINFFKKEQTKDEISKVNYLETCYKQGELAQKQYEPVWAMNSAFLEGKQWSEAFNADFRRFGLQETSAPNTKIKITSNQILPLARQAVAAITENLSDQLAIPATDDELDIFAAALSTDFLQSKYMEDKEQDKRLHEILGCLVFGRMLRKTTWNPRKESMSANGNIVRMGDIENITLDPSEFVQCPTDKGLSAQSWVIQTTIMDVDEINSKWPGHEVETEEVTASIFTSGRIFQSALFGAEYTPTPGNSCLLKQMYMRPSYDAPNGKYYAWAGRKLLAEDDLPNNVWPFQCIDWLPLRNKQYPLAFITNLIDPQKETNITYSQLIELKNRQLRGDIAVQGEGDVIQEILPTGQKVVRVSQDSTRWEFIKYEMQTTEAEVLLGRLWNDMMMIAGVRESSLGKQVAAGTPATTMMLTKESDMAGLQLFRKGFDLAYCDVSQIKLELAKQNYKAPRLIKVIGEDSARKVIAFLGSDLKSVHDVIPRSAPIVSETLKQQLMREAVQQGLYGPYASPQDKLAKITALLNSGIPRVREDVDAMLAPMTLEDLRKQCSELDAMQAMALALQTQAMIMQTTLQMQQMQQMANGGQDPNAEPEPVDQNGNPVQPNIHEQALEQQIAQNSPPAENQSSGGQQALPAPA